MIIALAVLIGLVVIVALAVIAIYNGLIQLMSKKDMKRLHKIDSPNMFDSMFMSYACKTRATERRQVNIPSIQARRMSR